MNFPSYKIRWKYDYLKLIEDHGYQQLFDWYCFEHPRLSKNRLARSFCLRYDLVKFADARIYDFFVVQEHREYSDHSRYVIFNVD